MKYTWKCDSCAIEDIHISQSTNPYRVGFEIYSKHARISPNCKNLVLEILEGDAETLIGSESLQAEIKHTACPTPRQADGVFGTRHLGCFFGRGIGHRRYSYQCILAAEPRGITRQ